MSFISNTRSFSDINITDNPDIFKRAINKFASDVFESINARIIGTYSTTPSVSGQTFEGAQAQRVVVFFDTLVNGLTSLTTPISSAASPSTLLLIISLSGTAQNGAVAVPLPYVNVLAPADGIQLSMALPGGSGTAVVNLLTTTSNWVGFRGFVVIEYAYVQV
jgi:hypothetical protein